MTCFFSIGNDKIEISVDFDKKISKICVLRLKNRLVNKYTSTILLMQ